MGKKHGSFKRLETYIPIRSSDLCSKLLGDRATLGADGHWESGQDEGFKEFHRRLSLHNRIRLTDQFDDWQEAYAFFDPDVDVVLPIGTGSREDFVSSLRGKFKEHLRHLLTKAGFDDVSQNDLEEAMEQRSIMGLDVKLPDPKQVQYELFFRGQRMKEFRAKSIATCYLGEKGVNLKTYQRIAMLFNIPDQQHELAPLCFCCNQPKNAIKAEEAIPGLWYLRIFKDVAVADIDMLLPGSEVKFTWMDHLMIWIPVVIGFVSAIYKLVQGTLNFSTTTNILTSLGLVAVPFSWGLKAYFKIKEKESTYHAHLTQLLSLHNLANNSGVLSLLLDEAVDQENNEALLAYFFLWRGQPDTAPIKQRSLDKDIEQFLNKFMMENDLSARIDFDVEDATRKLEELGLLTRVRGEDGEYLLKVMNLEQAMGLLEKYKFGDAKREERIGKVNWQECFGAFPPTGQRIRYFWNAATRESTYNVPVKYTAAPK
ncbi:hypothetical protein BSKO_10514 [Bryopsis sp. KO-2023]|nr:hypothetical protein BSKO_10514 [Bryopsis sp. KO-2023]